MIEIFDEIEQGTESWFQCRLGLPTASEFATVMSEGRADGTMPNPMIDAMVKAGCSASQLAAAVKAAKSKASNPAAMRAKYLRQLAGEIQTGATADSYTNVHMDRGRTMEDEARDLYAYVHDAEIKRVGFIKNGAKGCSPDSLVDANGGLEIKTALPHIQIDRLFRGTLPPEHKAQVQGSLWVAEREWWDFVSYWPKLPPLTIRVYRDEAYIRLLSDAVDAFNEELAAMVERIKRYEAPSEALKADLRQSVLLAG